jgi:ferredoxin
MNDLNFSFAEYCVIGSGAAAFGFLSGLTTSRGGGENLDDVVLITSDVGNRLQKTLGLAAPGQSINKDNNKVSRKPTKGKKLYFDDDYVYTRHDSWRVFSQGFGHVPSFSYGGLTRVWGATANLWPQEFLDQLGGNEPFIKKDFETLASGFFQTEALISDSNESSTNLLKVSDSLKNLLNETKHKRQRWNFRAAKLAIQTDQTSKHACTACGSCLNGCPSDAIWSADRALDPYLAKLGQVIIGLVLDIRILSDGVEVNYTSSDGCRRAVRAKYCVLAAGVPSTVKLFCGVSCRETTWGDDTPIQFRLGFSMNRDKNPSHNLAHVTGECLDFSVQLYPPNVQVWNRLFSPRLLNNRIIKRVLEHIAPIITYGRPVKNCITFDNEKFIAAKPKRNLGMQISLAIDLFRSGVLLIPFASQRGKFGESYHSGAFFKDLIKPNGFVSEKSRVYIADAAGLPFVRPGSITPTVILNSIRLGRHLESNRRATEHQRL